MKVAINWSYIAAGTVVIDVPVQTDLYDLTACVLPPNITGDGELQIDEVCQIDGLVGYENCQKGKLQTKKMFGIPYGLQIKIA
jgi:hypothetical protein